MIALYGKQEGYDIPLSPFLQVTVKEPWISLSPFSVIDSPQPYQNPSQVRQPDPVSIDVIALIEYLLMLPQLWGSLVYMDTV